ncbi:MAG: hypothetical protein FD122_1291 [Stygiobacter sp.]|nr:MAG: hypothetical protein FD122_1291 [Stygiobacter sp.]KAF0218130.1 MAG: hypothetical protein FD178_10 [Ignavibacteria bacterium]
MSSLKTVSTLNFLATTGAYLELSSLSKKNTELKKITKEIGEAQLKLQKQQLDIQAKTLIQQELQTKIMAQQAAQRERQKELKNAFYYLKTSLDTALAYNDNINRFIYLSLIERDIQQNELSPNELEEFGDKEKAEKIIREFRQQKENAAISLTDHDSKQLEDINKFNEINQELASINFKIKNFAVSNVNQSELTRLEKKLAAYKKKFVLKTSIRIYIVVATALTLYGIPLIPIFMYLTTTRKKLLQIESMLNKIKEDDQCSDLELHAMEKVREALEIKRQNLDTDLKEFIKRYPNLEFLLEESSTRKEEQTKTSLVIDGYELDEEITSLIRADQKIQAIKKFRQQTNLELLEAKNIIDKAVNKLQ